MFRAALSVGKTGMEKALVGILAMWGSVLVEITGIQAGG